MKGNISKIEKEVQEKMEALAAELRFEEAQELKEKLLLIRNFREKSEVVSHINYNLDVFSFEEEMNSAYINYLHIDLGPLAALPAGYPVSLGHGAFRPDSILLFRSGRILRHHPAANHRKPSDQLAEQLDFLYRHGREQPSGALALLEPRIRIFFAQRNE